MRSLFANTLICLSLLCSQALAQPATVLAPAPAANLGTGPSQSPQNAQQASSAAVAQTAEIASAVKLDNWVCGLYATRFDWWRLELVVTNLSTYQLQNCSPDAMNNLTTASAYAQLKALNFDNVFRGSAHQMLMDINLTPVVSEYYWVGNLKFGLLSDIRLNLWQIYQTTKLGGSKNLMGASYTPFKVRGNQHFIWSAGTLVHRLVAPDGKAYIMSSYTRDVQPSLNRENLSNINQLLRMPVGWTYENFFLDKHVVVRTAIESHNTVNTIFDDLSNIYVQYE